MQQSLHGVSIEKYKVTGMEDKLAESNVNILRLYTQ
jgi:hypothetical protein